METPTTFRSVCVFFPSQSPINLIVKLRIALNPFDDRRGSRESDHRLILLSVITQRLKGGSRGTNRVVRSRNIVATTGPLDLKVTNKSRHDSHQLNVRKLFTNTPMTTSTEWEVGGRGAFRDKTKPEIKLLSLLFSLLTLPAVGVKAARILKVFLVHSRNSRGSEQVMTLGDNPVGPADMHRRFDLSEN